MGKYTVIAPFKDAEEKRVRAIGETLETDEERGQLLLAKRVVKKAKEDPTPLEDENGIVHVGGGYYQLPNGEKTKGKEQALEALVVLQQKDHTGGSDDGNAGTNQISQEGTEQTTGS